MIKKLDIYIIKKFLGTFFFIISIFILIAVVFDVSEKIDDFVEKKAPVSAIIFEYYFNFIPWLYSILSSLLIFLAVIFFTSKMASNTEIVAILSSGISFRRMLVPYIIGAFILFCFSIGVNHFIIPKSNTKKIEFEEKYYRDHSFRNHNKNIHREFVPGEFMYFRNFSTNTMTGYNFSIEKFEGGRMVRQLKATRLVWSEENNNWSLRNWFERTLDGNKETIKKGVAKDTTFAFTHADFSTRPNNIETMDYFEIRDFVAKEKKKGSDLVKFYELEMHRRTAIPFSIFILTIIGVCISSRKVKGGLGMHLVYGICLGLVYVFSTRITEVFATNTGLSSLTAVWIPNFLFLILSLFIYRLAPK